MPKQLYKINQFHGGLNSNSDARDIADNELSEATDVMVDEHGRIRLMGGVALHIAGNPEDDQATGWNGVTNYQPGYGLFYFSHDRTGGENRSAFRGVHDGGDGASALTDSGESWIADAFIGGIVYNDTDGSSGPITDNTDNDIIATLAGGTDNDWDDDDAFHIDMPATGDDYIVAYDDHDQQFWIYSRVRDAWGTIGGDNGVIDMGTSSGANVCFYSADGAIRVSDGNFGSGNTNKWYGYIKRKHWNWRGGETSSHALATDVYFDSYSGWYETDQTMPAPTKGILGGSSGDGTGSGSQYMQITGAATSTHGSYPTTYLVDTDAWNLYTDADDFVDNDYVIVNTTNNEVATITNRLNSDTMVTTAVASNWENTDTWTLFPPAGGLGFNLEVNAITGTTGNQFEDWYIYTDYNVAVSFLYDNGQETALYIYRHKFGDIVTDKGVSFQAFFWEDYNPRYTGANVYFRDEDDQSGEWAFLFEIDFAKGTRKVGSNSYIGWYAGAYPNAGYPTNAYHKTHVINFPTMPLGVETYRSKSAISAAQVISSVQYKTAVVTNRRAYIGNVSYTDFQGDTHIKGDAIIKSPVNKFDVFALNGLIEASVNDGDEIVKLEAYADRLMIFKKRKLELVNVSQEVEFLEDTFMHKGISHPAATCQTDFGIAWVNNQGCYLYDGQKVNNLLENQGRQIIQESEWFNFLTPAKDGAGTALVPMIGYLPKKRQLIVFDDITLNSTADPRIYLYDIVTRSWTKGNNDSSMRILDINKTNLIIDWNSDLVYGFITGVLLKWEDNLANAAATVSPGVDIKTKDIDFGQPGQVKRIYKIYVTHRGSASNIQLSYAINGDQDTYEEGGMSELPATSAVTDWVTTALTPSTAPFSCTSLRLRLFSNGDTPANFEINDISIVFRLKGQR